jgi:membrane fusion protein (multidrug efflux system)
MTDNHQPLHETGSTEHSGDEFGETQSAPRARPQPEQEAEQQPAVSASKRKTLFIVFAAVIAAIAAGVWLYQTFIGSRSVSTDDAYVAAETAQVTPLTGGQVAELDVIDTQQVKKGQVLFRLAGYDQRISLASAEADYAVARRRYEQTLSQGSALSATADARGAALASARAQIAVAQADMTRARADLSRREALVGSGAVSGEELTTARNAYSAAVARVTAAQGALAQANADVASARSSAQAAFALVRGTSVDTAPEVRAAAARLEQAQLELDRTTVRAPVDGVVAKLAIQAGQRVAAGTVTMMIVPIDKLYVDANFKENQLGRVRMGQKVTLTSDYYGSKVVFHGLVAGFAGGTGAAFSPIPAQNATGNWIKVVQRLPLRVALNPRELRAHPLRVGLSMAAEIDLTDSN